MSIHVRGFHWVYENSLAAPKWLIIVLFFSTVMVGEEPHSNRGIQAKASICLKDKKIEELVKKTAQFER